MEQEIEQLKNQINELLEWKKEREEQQLTYPLDESSQAIVGTIIVESTDSTGLTQSYSVSGGGGGTVTAPKAYTTSLYVVINGIRYRIPTIG